MTLAAPVLSDDMDEDTATCPASRAWQDALIDADVLHHLLQSMGFKQFHGAAEVCRSWLAAWRALWMVCCSGVPPSPFAIHRLSLTELQPCFGSICSERVAEALFIRAKTFVTHSPSEKDASGIMTPAAAEAFRKERAEICAAAQQLIELGAMQAIVNILRQRPEAMSALDSALKLALSLYRAYMFWPSAQRPVGFQSTLQLLCEALDTTELRRALPQWKGALSSYELLFFPWSQSRVALPGATRPNYLRAESGLPPEAIPAFVRCGERGLRISDRNSDAWRMPLFLGLNFVASVWRVDTQRGPLREWLKLSDAERAELQGRTLKAGCPELLISLLQRDDPPEQTSHQHAQAIVLRDRVATVLARMAASADAPPQPTIALALEALVRMMLDRGEDEASAFWSERAREHHRGTRKRALHAFLDAGKDAARELAIAAGARDEWLTPLPQGVE